MADSRADVWLGIDIGTQSVRAVAIDDDGAVCGTGGHPLTGTRDGDRHEQDPETWWVATAAAVGAATSTLQGGPSAR